MRFLRPNRIPADAEISNARDPIMSGPSISSGETGTVTESPRMDDARSPSRPSEGVRILLERIDTLTARLQACEQTIEQLELQASTQVELHVAELKEAEERLRRQIERQIADHAADTERRQKEFVSKQAKFLELLASELSKVRSMAEANAGTQEPETPDARPGRPPHSHRHRNQTEAGVDLEFFDLGGDVTGSSPRGSTRPHDRAQESREVEFWDWLESLPQEPGDDHAAHDISFDDLDKGRSR